MTEHKGEPQPLALQWRPRANLDRQSIAIYLGIECGQPQAALKAVQNIDEAIEQVRLFPQLGRQFKHERLTHEYRVATAFPYNVYYRYDENAVTIYRILHQRQNIGDYELVGL